jgi:flagellar motor switch protein FliM
MMINRRGENSPAQEVQKLDIKQQKFVRHVVGNAGLNVDYVLDGGSVPLALLRKLAPGSVVPLANLSDAPLEARANEAVLFNGVLQLTADHIGMTVTRVLAGGADE